MSRWNGGTGFWKRNPTTRVGDAHYNAGRPDDALAMYQRSLEVGFDVYALLGVSSIYCSKGNYKEAEAACNEILNKVPAHYRALKELIIIYEEQGDTDKALEIRNMIQK